MFKSNGSDKLRDQIQRNFKADNGRTIRPPILPQKHIYFKPPSKKNGNVLIHQPRTSVVQNMQMNMAAFEAWAFVLRRWSDYEKITLSWDIPVFNTKNEKYHYQRYLYRVKQFSKLYNRWFSVSAESVEQMANLEIRSNGKYVLNVPTSKSKEPLKYPDLDKMSENKLEWHIILDNSELKKTSGVNILHRQLPVGLYKDKVATRNNIFTGKSSALDLWGLNSEGYELSIFELKKFKNKPVGIISELFFYSMVMLDIMNGNFEFKKIRYINDIRGNYETIANAKKLNAYFLVTDMHPLIDPKMLNDMNTFSGNDPVRFGHISIGQDGKFKLEYACS